MPDINPSAPAETEVAQPQSYDDQIEDLAELLGDPAEEPAEAEAPEAAPIDDDPDGLNEIGAEDVATDDDANPDESEEPEIKGGRFAPDSAKVTLDDGTVTTIAELKRGTLFQRDYTQKTQALSAEKKAFEAERESVSQYVQQLNQARDYIAWYAEQHIPKDPGPYTGLQDDFVGYQNWQKQRDAYGQHLQAYQLAQQLKQTEEQRKAGETQQQAQARMQEEADALRKAYPILNDATKGPLFLQATARDASKYFDLTADELRQTVQDRRLFKILRSAIERERLKEQAPKLQAEIAKRPAMRGGQRSPVTATVNRDRQSRTERLRKTGSLEDGIAALMDFDL
jgi:vacuolar-type H+-ATPase subunit I/STV1